MFRHEVGVFRGVLCERGYGYAFGQVLLGLQRGAELVVDDEIERRAQIGDIAPERLVGVHGNVQTVDVQPVVGGEHLGNIGVFVSFHLTRGEAETPEIGEGGVTHGVERGGAVGTELLAALPVEVDILFFAVHCCFAFLKGRKW